MSDRQDLNIYNNNKTKDSGKTQLLTNQNYVVPESPIQIIRTVPSLNHFSKSQNLVQIETKKVVYKPIINNLSRPESHNNKVKTYKKTDINKDIDLKPITTFTKKLDLQTDIKLKATKTMNNTKTATKRTEKITRSKSDLYYDPKANIPPEQGTLSSRIAPWKSTINIPVAVENCESKKKSYNREEARRFMEEQKKKRRSNLGKENNKNEINRDEIKKRLQILQKNTKEILEKNVKTLARKRVNNAPKYDDVKLVSPTKNRRLDLVFKPNPARAGIKPLKDLIAEENKRNNVQPKPTESDHSIEKCSDNELKQIFISLENIDAVSENQDNIIKNIETISSGGELESKDSELKIPIVPGLNKKIGLLRKPETQDHSFSALNDVKTDKETAILNMITPTLKENLKSVNIEEKNTNNRNENIRNNPNSATSSKSSFTVKASKRFSNEFQLDVPPCSLKTSQQEKSVQAEPSIVFRQNEELPFWLKPNPVQVYPYNFIMAVRKKLEAITNPVLKTSRNNINSGSKDDIRRKSCDKTPVSYRKDKRSINVKRRLTSTAEETSCLPNNCSSGKSHSSKVSLSEPSYSFSSEKLTDIHSKQTSTSSKNSRKSMSRNVGKDSSNSSYYNLPEKRFENTQTKESNPSSKLKTFDVPNLETYNKLESKIDDPISKLKDASKSISELTSNFSSISIHVPESNTVSEVSSIRSETNHGEFLANHIATDKKKMKDDDEMTTASSSVFSSPEKTKKSNTIDSRALSPLSIENISNLYVKSSGKSKELTRVHQYNPLVPPLDLKTPHSDCSKSTDNNASERSDVDFNRLLEDFNRSLSQVLEVNDQLKSTINKTNTVINKSEIVPNNEIITPISVKSTDDYFSDFEDLSSSVKNSNEQTEKNKEENHIVSRFNPEVSTLKSPDSIHLSKDSLRSSKFSKLESFGTPSGKTHQLKANIDNQNEAERSLSKPLSTQNSNNSKFDSENTDKTISEEINEYSNNENVSGNMNQFSKDSLDLETENEDTTTTVSKTNYIKSNINVRRGDFNDNFDKKPEAGPPGYVVSEKFNVDNTNLTTSSVGSDFIAIFNQSDVEMSIYSQSRSETMNYSSIGMYEQLIQSESNKSDQLASLLKMREKALLDRTKAQIAWLELQKEKYKSKGLTVQISAVKKKQRGVLMKMEKEREEIKKLLKNQTIAPNKHFNSKSLSTAPQQQIPKIYHPKLIENLSDIAIRKSFLITGANSARSNNIVRGYELEGSKSLEILLQKREEELRKRRAHVEKLMEWHQRLDQEEQEVLQLEQLLLNCNDQQQHKEKVQTDHREMKKERKLKEIDKSLRELSSISSKSTIGEPNASVEADEDFVEITGSKLNKLWRRLTSQKFEKFDPTKTYKLCKIDLEKIYEEAKMVVIAEFGNTTEMNKILNKSNSICSAGGGDSVISGNESQPATLTEEPNGDSTIIPKLNLNFSSGQSDNEFQENYSPSLAEEKFQESQRSQPKDNESNSNANTNPTIADSSESVLKLDPIPKDFIDIEIESISSNKVSEPSDSKTEHVDESSKIEEYDTFESIESTTTIKSENKSQSNSKSVSKVEQNEYPEPCSTVNSCTAIEKDLESKNTFESSNNFGSETNITSEEETKESSEQTINFASQTSSIVEEVVSPSKLSNSEISTDNSITIGNTNQHNSNDESYINEILVDDKSKHDGTVSDEFSHESRNSVIVSQILSPTDISLNSDTLQVSSKEENLTLMLTETIHNIGSQEINSETNCSSKDKEVFSENMSYENDFSYGEETFLDDITAPIFEKTIENQETVIYSNNDENQSDKPDMEESSETLEKRLICLDTSLKGLQNTFDRALSPEKMNTLKTQLTPPPFNPTVQGQVPTKQLQISNAVLNPPTTLEADKENKPSNSSHQLILNKDFNKMAQNSANNLMPDIISEVEIRRQQILLENEIKHLEHTVPYNMYLREIPNKPPPPYVPPAHGSPMTTIFPSEERIQEITFRRIKELYDEIVNNDAPRNENKSKPPSVLDENITNIYERIILDICKECMTDYQVTLMEANPENYKNPLAFYNPPDRLQCMQNFVYKQIRKYLAMDKIRPKQNSIFGIGRRKRDHVDEILVQELFEEEAKWTNFDTEEAEVKAAIIDEICNDIIRGVIEEVVEGHKANVDGKSIST